MGNASFGFDRFRDGQMCLEDIKVKVSLKP